MSDSDSAQSGVRTNEAYDRVFAVGHTSDPIPVVDVEREESLYEPLTDSLRRLIDVTIRSEAADSVVTQASRSAAKSPAPMDQTGSKAEINHFPSSLVRLTTTLLAVNAGSGRSLLTVS
ncbi:thioesterase family protein [Mycolicibacterium brisbanense]|uniref:Thioesterase family protein n=1 Tax=Mycolicibacterium brisbanense TaxID=146020 RepID=A0A117I6D4_9MYCO|nr:thioesterase family protein [Mycolicibacterium brisbanense]